MKVFVCLLALALTAAIAADDIAGSWTFDLVQFGEETSPARVELKTNGETVTGTLNELKIEGTWKDGVLKVKVTRPTGNEWGTIEGRLNGADLRGTVHRGSDNLEWVARRVPAPSSAAPQTHAFEPTAFHRYFSGTIAPALHINPGDTVRTTTVDAGGTDFTGKRRSLGGNPETGPFYIEGAMPGDTLIVKFTRVRLNRDSAMSGDSVVPSALNPGYFRGLEKVEKFDSEWKLDRDNGMAMLKNPTERLRNYRVPLRPMLGCVAVAPAPGQTLRAGYLGPFGGNMDYNELRESTTVYLPVNVPGALLFIGDGHALQGDGELTGDALETSMEVEFTVNVEPDGGQRQPRFENDDYIMLGGIGNSLPEAVQQATTGMSQYLAKRYKLNPAEVAIVLGTAVRYDIAELVDPLVHVVAKLPRKTLAGLQ